MTEAEVRSLTLKRGKFEKSTLYKVKKGWKVKFKFSPEFLPEDNLSLLINFPIEGASFIRDKYAFLFRPWCQVGVKLAWKLSRPQFEQIVIDSDEEATVGAACPGSRKSFSKCRSLYTILHSNT